MPVTCTLAMIVCVPTPDVRYNSSMLEVIQLQPTEKWAPVTPAELLMLPVMRLRCLCAVGPFELDDTKDGVIVSHAFIPVLTDDGY